MNLTQEQKVTLYKNLIRADHYDKCMYKRMAEGELIGFYHSGEGCIAPEVAAATFLNQDDFHWPHYRAHGMAGLVSRGVELKHYLAEHTGKEGGCCQGRSTFHPCFPEYKQFTFSGLIGLPFSIAVGWGWAAKRNSNNQVLMLCTGDGSYSQGRAHEAMLMAQNWKLPIIFWCENNGLAIFAEMSEMHPTKDISSLAKGYNMSAIVVDGQDVFKCGNAALTAIAHCRAGNGPIFIECKTLRFKEHSIGSPDLAGFKPRSKELHAEMRKRDPVVLATEHVLNEGILDQIEIDQVNQDATEEVKDGWAWADAQPKAMPTEEELLDAVYAP